jgi:hypothetical protein
MVRPHEWNPPAATLEKTSELETFVGMVRLAVVPSPSHPPSFEPQQYATPAVVTPQLKSRPALMLVKERPPATAVGTALRSDELMPSSPNELEPQQ